MQAGHLSAARARGFTFLELVVVIAVLGIVSVAVGKFMLPAITAQQDVERRAVLVEAADSALRRMARDIRVALPGSLRITNTIVGGSGFALEMIPTVDGARYCTTAVANCATGNVLNLGVNDTNFDILGCFRHSFVTGAATTAFRLVIGASSAVYTATGSPAIITPVLTNITPSLFPNTPVGTATCGNASSTANSYNRHRLTYANHNFPNPGSTRQRVFVVRDSAAPVTYLCNATAGTLMRYEGYKGGVGTAYGLATPPNNGGAAPLSTATLRGRVADNISACSVTSTDALVQGTSVVTLSLTLSSSGETVQLMSQVQLDNSP